MIFDTDVLVWALRGHVRAAATLDKSPVRKLSVVSYMELLQGARDKRELRLTKAYLADLGFEIVPLSENIGHRASIYLEEYGLRSRLGVPDALIAASAVENGETLCTGNAKHFRDIADLEIKAFRP